MTGADGAGLALRAAVDGDCRLLFDWANDPETRRMSFSERPIAWEEHRRWFAERLRDPRCLLYILCVSDGTPIGLVRFDVDQRREAVLSLVVAPERRGRGHGAAAIRLATQESRRARGVTVVRAYVRPENRASVLAFEKAGYHGPERVDYRGGAALVFYSGRSNQDFTSNA